MKKRSKLSWAGLFLATVIFLAALNYLDAKLFDKLNVFHKKEPAQTQTSAQGRTPGVVSEMTGTDKALQQQTEEAKEESLKSDLGKQDPQR